MVLFGSPSEQQAKKLNPKYNYLKMPHVDAQPIGNYFPKSTPDSALDLLVCLMDYDPGARLTAAQALTHPFFDELRHPSTALPEGHVLFEMTDEECEYLKKVANG